MPPAPPIFMHGGRNYDGRDGTNRLRCLGVFPIQLPQNWQNASRTSRPKRAALASNAIPSWTTSSAPVIKHPRSRQQASGARSSHRVTSASTDRPTDSDRPGVRASVRRRPRGTERERETEKEREEERGAAGGNIHLGSAPIFLGPGTAHGAGKAVSCVARTSYLVIVLALHDAASGERCTLGSFPPDT